MADDVRQISCTYMKTKAPLSVIMVWEYEFLNGNYRSELCSKSSIVV